MNMRKTTSAAVALFSLAYLVAGAMPVAALSNTCNFGTVAASNFVCTSGFKSCTGPCTLTSRCTISGTGIVACMATGDVDHTCGSTLTTCTVTATYFAPAGTSMSAQAVCFTSPSLTQVTVATGVSVTCSIN
jgi:hypothetical protein